MTSAASDNTLVHRLEKLLCDEHEREADLLVHIGEVDERKLFAHFAYSSMFRYCESELLLSESQAYKRIHAARAARKIPALLEMIARGDLHLTALVLLTQSAPAMRDFLGQLRRSPKSLDISQELQTKRGRKRA